MGHQVTVEITDAAHNIAKRLFEWTQTACAQAPIPFEGRNLQTIQNDYMARNEKLFALLKESHGDMLAALKLDKAATTILTLGTPPQALYWAQEAYPTIYFDALPDGGKFYGFYPVDYQGKVELPNMCRPLTGKEEQMIGERLFAGGWNNPPAILSPPCHGIALPAGFDPADLRHDENSYDPYKDMHIYCAPDDANGAVASFKARRDFRSTSIDSLMQQIQKAGREEIIGDKDDHINLILRRPEQDGAPPSIEISFSNGNYSYGTQYESFDLAIRNNKLEAVFHERTEKAKALKALAQSIGCEPSLAKALNLASPVYLHEYGGHDFIVTFEEAGFKPVPIALYRWLRMEDENSGRYEKLPPRSPAFYTMYEQTFGAAPESKKQPIAAPRTEP